jgi:hypothetical protein
LNGSSRSDNDRDARCSDSDQKDENNEEENVDLDEVLKKKPSTRKNYKFCETFVSKEELDKYMRETFKI